MDDVDCSGGLFLCWSASVVVVVLFKDVNYVLCNVTNELNVSYYVLCVYGSPYLAERAGVWRTRRSLIWAHPGKLVMIGDFNQVKYSAQKKGGNSIIPGVVQFSKWKLECALMDIDFQWALYTWSNNREGNNCIWERLDRAYATDEWRSTFPNAVIWNMPILLSDHNPIVLECEPSGGKKRRPYKLDQWCLKVEQAQETITREWDSEWNGLAMFVLQRKIHTLVRECKKWCLDYKCENKIDWNLIQQDLLLHQNNTQEKANMDEAQIRRLAYLEEIEVKSLFWRQRARLKWDTLGDQGTSFFYKCVKSRKSQNDIKAIRGSGGDWLFEPTEIKEEFLWFYQDLFIPVPAHESIDLQWADWNPKLKKLETNHLNILNSPFSMQEIKDAAMSMKAFKSPGPDGVAPGFYHSKWELVQKQVTDAVFSFFTGGFMLREMNATFITVIPKVERPETVSEFRPISLCNTPYKIISKCLVRRLRKVVEDLVGDSQNAFVPGRKMSDSCLIGHEMLHSMKKKKGSALGAIFKVDLNKAYDRVRWDFLQKVLEEMNFPPKWVNWIMQCVTTVSYSVPVSGEPTEKIFPKVGLGQGDPLSPYLFILCMEVLAKKLIEIQENKRLQGLKAGRRAPMINHLFFADDALFFVKASTENFRVLKDTIDNFCSISGEMINLQKILCYFLR